MKKIAIVTHRYGKDIGGGAETLMKEYASILSKEFEVTIITSKAKDHTTWRNEIESDEEILDEIKVLRFPVDHERDISVGSKFHKLSLILEEDPTDIDLGLEFMRIQGPYSSKLLDFLRNNIESFDYFVYEPYLYATTFYGAQITPREKNIMIPAAHDEAFLHMAVMHHSFSKISRIIFLTEEERELVLENFNYDYDHSVIGMGITSTIPASDFDKKFKLKNPCIIYVGRIEEGKGVSELIQYFTRLKSNDHKLKLDLVLVGKSIMPIPKKKDIIHLGFISEEDKIAAIQKSICLIQPSKFESFSIVTLEAMLNKIPVIVNAKCLVLKGHAEKSNAGLWYNNFSEFELTIKYLLRNKNIAKIMGANGEKYVKLNYSPNKINKKLLEFFKK